MLIAGGEAAREVAQDACRFFRRGRRIGLSDLA
jgi:hypothetical protein